MDDWVKNLRNKIGHDTVILPHAVTIVIEESINCLLELTGERVTEAVVDKVFSNFCVGK